MIEDGTWPTEGLRKWPRKLTILAQLWRFNVSNRLKTMCRQDLVIKCLLKTPLDGVLMATFLDYVSHQVEITCWSYDPSMKVWSNNFADLLAFDIKLDLTGRKLQDNHIWLEKKLHGVKSELQLGSMSKSLVWRHSKQTHYIVYMGRTKCSQTSTKSPIFEL
jgi:hypothetical protein